MLTASRIKQRALDLGFDLCGIAAADAYPELRFLDEWLGRGYAAGMEWLKNTADRRADVRALLPGARSVIVTGALYNSRRSRSGGTSVPPSEPPATATIARYAWGDDYHHVLQRRLDALIDWMQGESAEPFEARAYVDGGPVQERVYAQYAGLGWIGKNTCLINRDIGSLFFLSEIICTLPLEPDTQALEQCGSCTRCIEACPTGALVESGVLDANRCISYLTIENRGPIPEDLRPALGSHIYGCDICQTVCPYNEAAPRSADPAWQPQPGLHLPRLVDLWARPDEELAALIRPTAMTRARLTGLRRNLAVAIGNSGDADAVAALVVPFADRPSVEDPMVQAHVDWAVARNRELP
jgi:epoxyqueuosine reductase